LKQEGNELFRAGKWEASAQRFPKRPSPPLAQASRNGGILDDLNPPESEDIRPINPESQATDEPIPLQGRWDADCAKSRAVLHSNITACYIKIVSALHCHENHD
jgi:hypothetical protein